MNDLLKMDKDDCLVIRKGIENSIVPVCSLEALQKLIKSVGRMNWGLSQKFAYWNRRIRIRVAALSFLCKSLFNKTVFFV